MISKLMNRNGYSEAMTSSPKEKNWCVYKKNEVDTETLFHVYIWICTSDQVPNCGETGIQ
jgi:hypothetical protein